MSRVASLAETRAAQAFLKTIGADVNNKDLIRGVIAWFHQESGSIARVIGNNPFNIRNDPMQIGQRQTRNGNGKFAIFATLAIGFQAAARLLLRGMSDKGDWRGYGLVVRAARSGRILDFLQAIAMSKWDAAHYGWSPEHPDRNHLIGAYNAITGLTLSVPGTGKSGSPKPTPKPKKRRLPARPRDIPAPFEPSPYMDAYAVGRSYRERHKDMMGNVALDGPGGL